MDDPGWHERATWCWICGRPLGQGEDFGRWRLRTARLSLRYGFVLRPVCPAHHEGWPQIAQD